MSMNGAPDCPICGAHSDYCTLTTATGVLVDCRALTLRNPDDLEAHRSIATMLTEEGDE